MKVSWCDELDAPELGVIMDDGWLRLNESALASWLRDRGGSLSMGLVYLPDPNQRLLFALRWTS